MDFTAFDPSSSNSLNLAARTNDVKNVKRLLKRNNPNCEDNRGWTCLHEAAAHDSYESLLLIIQHPDCRLLAETFEGHSALYVACMKVCSMRTIQNVLENIQDIANIASTEMVTPLHMACTQGRTELVEMLIAYGAILDAQDFDGDTPLHNTAFNMRSEEMNMLLHAGANPDVKNDMLCTALHLACVKGFLQGVTILLPFISDINSVTCHMETPLTLAVQSDNTEIVEILLKHNANPNIRNSNNALALDLALTNNNVKIFNLLLSATDNDKISENIMITACKEQNFNIEIITSLLESDLSPNIFNTADELFCMLISVNGIIPKYTKNMPLNSFLDIIQHIYNQSDELCYKLFHLLLTKGVSVNAMCNEEFPPIVYMQDCALHNCFVEILKILVDFGCDIDYSSIEIPDAFFASIANGGKFICVLLPYSLWCEPIQLIKFYIEAGKLNLLSEVLNTILSLVDIKSEGLTVEKIPYFVPALKHLVRVEIRNMFRRQGVKGTHQFLKSVQLLPLPIYLKSFIRYL